MTTDVATAVPSVNLDPNAAEKRSLTDIYRVKSAAYEYASEEYSARAGGARPLQFTIEWEALTFRFADNPTTNPILKRSINVTDKNGAVMTWGDPANPEPTAEDSFPIQVSKHFAKCGTILGTDPHIIDGQVYLCERRTLRAGKSEVTTLVPLERLPDTFTFEGDVRVVQGKESGTAGNPATGVTAAPTGPSAETAFKALAAAMNGKGSSEMVNVALSDATVSQQSDVLQQVAAGAPAIEALKAFGTFSPEGVFAAA